MKPLKRDINQKELIAQLALKRAQLLLDKKGGIAVSQVIVLNNNDFTSYEPYQILGHGYALKEDCLLISYDACTILVSAGEGKLIFDNTKHMLNTDFLK